MYTKKDATMTHGLAILSMVILHLFCRKGGDVFGTPLLWINTNTPLVYLFGFFCEICVPLYSVSAGYARQLSAEKNESYSNNLRRLFRLLVNYWIVLVLFSAAGLLYGSPTIPVDAVSFVKSIFLLHSYNGSWWYLNTYFIISLIPASIVLFPVRKLSCRAGLSLCLVLSVLIYGLNHIGFLSASLISQPILHFICKETVNLLNILPAYLCGAFLCRYRVFSKISHRMKNDKHHNMYTYIAIVMLFIVPNAIHKAVLMPVVAIAVFLAFNLLEKHSLSQSVFLFFGKHSTNIWLVHMFFYFDTFGGIALKCQYPLLIFAALMALSILSSYIILFIQNLLFSRLSKTFPRL